MKIIGIPVLIILAIIGALVVVLLLATQPVPSLASTTYTCFGAGTPTPQCTTSGTLALRPPMTGLLFAQDVSCSLSSGTCAMSIINNSTVPVQIETCSLAVGPTNAVSGTLQGGAANNGIAPGSQQTVTCTLPPAQLEQEQLNQTPSGSTAAGVFTAKCLAPWYSYPAGTQTYFDFHATWS